MLTVEEVILFVVRDLPSTAILVLFVWLVNKQFNEAMELLRQHFSDLNKLLDQCIKRKNLDDKLLEVDAKLSALDRLVDDMKKKNALSEVEV